MQKTTLNDPNTQEGTGGAGESLGVSADTPVVTVDTFSPSVSGGAIRRNEAKAGVESSKNRINEDSFKNMSLTEATRAGNVELASDSDVSLRSEATVASLTAEGRVTRSRAAKKRRRKSKSLSSTDNDADNRVGPKDGFLVPSKRFLKQPRPEQEVEELARVARENRAALGLCVMESGDSRTSAALSQQVISDVEVILSVAAKSKNLKGTFQRALKDSAASIKCAVETITTRSTTEEVAKIQEENARLHREVEELRKELAEFRQEMSQSKQKHQPPAASTAASAAQSIRREGRAGMPNEYRGLVEEITRSIMVQVGTVMNARFQVIEERLPPVRPVRPPLAADQRSGVATGAPVSSGTTLQPDNISDGRKNRKGKFKRTRNATDEPDSNVPMMAVPTESGNEGWSSVVKRNGKRKVVSQNAPRKDNKSRSGRPKLRPPRSAAVVITLQPGAEEKEMSYAKVLTEARRTIDISGLGIPALRYRQAATGARILEVPGVQSGEMADTLAKKLKEFLPEDVVRVSRPIKCAELRILGLDDSVNEEDVISAVVQQGECSAETIRVGNIRRSPRGTGTVWVRCPVAAASKLAKKERILIGWISAPVRLLEKRPLRCYKCLQSGHVRVQCNADIDRSNECYRCGQNGHKARVCSAAPKCSLCSEANKPADHILGSKKCFPPKIRRNDKVASGSVPLQPRLEEEMITS